MNVPPPPEDAPPVHPYPVAPPPYAPTYVPPAMLATEPESTARRHPERWRRHLLANRPAEELPTARGPARSLEPLQTDFPPIETPPIEQAWCDECFRSVFDDLVDHACPRTGVVEKLCRPCTLLRFISVMYRRADTTAEQEAFVEAMLNALYHEMFAWYENQYGRLV